MQKVARTKKNETKHTLMLEDTILRGGGVEEEKVKWCLPASN